MGVENRSAQPRLLGAGSAAEAAGPAGGTPWGGGPVGPQEGKQSDYKIMISWKNLLEIPY